MNLVGTILGGRYDIIEEIGKGGMATVYKAKCKLLNRYVAVKVLKDEFAKDAQFVKRFRAEAQSAASLTHPNIVSVYDVGEENGINYIVMECLEGKTLKDYIEQKGKLGNELTLKFASQIASALEAAHKAKIIHRDIKPQNIVFSNNENIVKVTDFGIAKMTTTNTITSQGNTMGSVHYFSPEHAKGCYIDEKSDIYSLGVVMYEMATGKLPFNADTAVSVALKQIQEEPVAPNILEPSISDDLNRIILKAMQKNATNRYSSATQMLDDIFAAINNPGHIFKSEPKIVPGGTQIIPVIGLKNTDNPSISDLEENDKKDIIMEEIKPLKRDYLKIDNLDNEEKENSGELSNNSFDDNKQINKSKKKKIIIIVCIIAAICVTTLTILAIDLVKTFREKNKIEQVKVEVVPDLLDKNFEEVKEQYDILGLTIELDKYEFNPEIEEGNIISQSLKAGDKLTAKSMTVVVSKGKEMVKMIDVIGKDYTVAKYELDSLGVIPDFQFEEDEKIEKNIIISQSVTAKEDVAVGEKIVIKVSEGNGKQIAIMPNILGYTEAAAKKSLQALKLNVDIAYSEDKEKPNGVVIIQSKKENEELEEGTLVTVTINRLQKSKSIEINLAELIPTGETAATKVKVIAKVEGVDNTIYNETVESPYNPITVQVNGFTTATLYIYINETKASEQEVTF